MSTVVDCTAVALNQRKRVLPCFDMVAEPWTGAKLSIARVVMAAAVVIALMALGMQLAETGALRKEGPQPKPQVVHPSSKTEVCRLPRQQFECFRS